MTNINNTLVEIREIISGPGETNVPASDQVSDGNIFDTIFQAAVARKFTKQEAFLLNAVLSYYGKALLEARRGFLNTAEFYYKKAEEHFEKGRTAYSPDLRAYMEVYIAPNKAYFEYKNKRYDKALEALLLAIDMQGKLEDEIPVIHMGKVQQLHNVGRMLFRQKKYEEAIRINKMILRYLMLEEAPEFHGRWDKKYFEEGSQSLRSAMIHQVFEELVANQTRYTFPYSKKEIFYDVFFDLKKYQPLNEEDKAYGHWINGMDAIYNGRNEAFLFNLKALLSARGTRFDVLKYDLLSNAMQVLNNEGGTGNEPFSDEFSRTHEACMEFFNSLFISNGFRLMYSRMFENISQ